MSVVMPFRDGGGEFVTAEGYSANTFSPNARRIKA
jgi:hypothetical protein